ncbi:hypothetical protein [Streptacidiphilus sp. EB103A]|uniref:hypothetical protein n=1 Tax=Streptacidiphilus sp. EB103A TaxID=3156275 RepID=UPI0035155AED
MAVAHNGIFGIRDGRAAWVDTSTSYRGLSLPRRLDPDDWSPAAVYRYRAWRLRVDARLDALPPASPTSVSDGAKANAGLRLRHLESGMRHGLVRHPDGQPPLPGGCRWCGVDHFGQWFLPGRGYHAWVQPTQAQIGARMRARRNAVSVPN